MSRIGKKPVAVPSGVKIEVANHTVKTSGPKGSLQWRFPEGVDVAYAAAAAQIRVTSRGATSQDKALYGLARALIANMIQGVHEGFRKAMEVYGTGFSWRLQAGSLLVNCGYMGRGFDRTGKPKEAQFTIPVPQGLSVTVEVPVARGESEPAKLTIEGPDKQQVGQFAAELRRLRPPEPYKGKGIRYAGEQIRRKQGKAFVGGAT